MIRRRGRCRSSRDCPPVAHGEAAGAVVGVVQLIHDRGAGLRRSTEQRVGLIGDDVDRVQAGWDPRELPCAFDVRAEHDAAAFGPAQFGVVDVAAVVALDHQRLLEAEGIDQELDFGDGVRATECRPNGGCRCVRHAFRMYPRASRGLGRDDRHTGIVRSPHSPRPLVFVP